MNQKKEFNRKEKKGRTYRFSGDVRAFLESRPNATEYLENLVRKEKDRESSIFVIDLGAFNSRSKKEILELLQREGVAVQEITARISAGYIVE